MIIDKKYAEAFFIASFDDYMDRSFVDRPALGRARDHEAARNGCSASVVAVDCPFPVAGAVIYLLIGERRIGHGRTSGIQSLSNDYRRIADAAIREGLTQVDWSRHAPAAAGMNHLGRAMAGIQTVRGSSFEIFSDTPHDSSSDHAGCRCFRKKCVDGVLHLERRGGLADDVLNAVIRAAQRGVHCCLLIDALGARPWWKGDQPKRLREAGVELRSALPVGLSAP